MKKLLLTIASLAILQSGSYAALIAGWDFQTTANGGTAAAANPSSPLVYNANFGSGTLYLNGTNGSSTWTSAASSPQVTSFGGTAVNAGPGFSTITTGTASLALANSSSNGFSTVFVIDASTVSDSLVLSYATQGTATGFNSQVWDYSNDGVSWTSWEPAITIPSSFATRTLGAITALNGDATAFVRLTVTGASATAGNNRFDNIQSNSVPEPSGALLAGIAGLGVILMRRRRQVS